MKPAKSRNEAESTVKSTTKYAFVPPGSIGKGRGRGLGLKSMCSLGVSRDEVGSFGQGSLYGSPGMRTSVNPSTLEKMKMQTEFVLPQSSDTVMKCIETLEAATIGKARGRGIGLKSMCSSGVSKNEVGNFSKTSSCAIQGMRRTSKNPSALEKDDIHSDFSMASSTEKVKKSAQTYETTATGEGQAGELKSMFSLGASTDEVAPINITRLDSSKYAGQGKGTTRTNSIHIEKEHVQTDSAFPPLRDQVIQHSQTVETSSSTTKKVKRVRGKNKCKEVAALEVGKRLKVTFYNNRTVGDNHKSFARHLGKLVRDRNMCPLGVSSWHNIKEDKLNHMWAAIEDKFESDDMDIHREHIFKWMKQLWDRWRGNLHAKYVRGKSIQEALRNMPTGIDKKQWEWLVKNHFFTESFQARSTRNRKNRSKLKMPHHIGSKPIREIIYQKGGKDGNPPDLATIFFETRKKNEKLIDSESIEKHAQLQELVQSEPSLSSIEIVEKCFGPQNCSHVFGFGGGVKAKDLKGGMPSKSELMSELRSTREENQSLKDRLSTVENDLKGLMQLKELLLAQLHLFQETNYLLMNIPGFGD